MDMVEFTTENMALFESLRVFKLTRNQSCFFAASLLKHTMSDIAYVLLFVFQFLLWPTKSSPFLAICLLMFFP